MKKILVPYDYSEVANYAVDFAVQLALKSDACEVSLFHVIEHPSASRLKYMGISDADPMETLYMKKLIEQAQGKMDEAIENYGNANVDITKDVRLGNPDYELIQEVDDSKVDLIVMGTSGAEGLDEFFVGSNSERVVRHAKCPVVTLSAKARANIIKEIVFASDFETIDENFVKRMLHFRDLLGARLRIVIINTPASFTSSRLDNKLMDKFAKNHSLTNYTTEIYNYSNEEDGIVAYAEDIGAHMIALGTNQLTGVKHFLKGSIAEDVVNHASVPVWTYHFGH